MTPHARGASTRPNFLIFCADQMQSFSLGCNGNGEVRTPNLDRLASEGATFTRAYCNNTVCTPSRATMITGLTPRQNGCLPNGNCLPENVPAITQALVAAGYRTHTIGKVHLQPFGGGSSEDRSRWLSGEIDSLPSDYYGFQTSDFVGGHGASCFGDYVNDIERRHPGTIERMRPENSYRILQGTTQCWRINMEPDLHYNHWIADRALAFLESDDGSRPFFLWCSFPDPHLPMAACNPYNEMYDPASLSLNPSRGQSEDPCEFLRDRRARGHGHRWADELTDDMLREMTAQTYGMITHIDDNIGRVMRRLEQSGLAENTLVVFLADHGEYLGSHNLLFKNAWPYEELVRIPFIWKARRGQQAERGQEAERGQDAEARRDQARRGQDAEARRDQARRGQDAEARRDQARRGQDAEARRDRILSPEAAEAACDHVTGILDFAPTILDFAGIDESALDTRGGTASDRDILPGRSLRPFLTGGQRLDERPALIEYDEDWFEGPICRHRTLVTGRHKLTFFAGWEEGLLFDLQEDPHETRNMWNDAECRGIKAELTERLLDELVRTERFDTRRICGA